MAKTKFDYSLLEPEESKFDTSALEPVEEEEIKYTPPPPRKGAAGVWEDIKEVPGHIMDYGYELGSQVPDFWKQLFTNPKRAAKNFILGAGEAAEAPINLLGQVGPYAKSRGIPGLGSIPGFKIPEVGIEKAFDMGEQQPGDIVGRNMFMFGGAPSLLKAIPGVSKTAERLGKLKERSPLQQKIEELAKHYQKKAEEHGIAKTEYSALKDILESEPGVSSATPSVLRRKAQEAEQTIGVLRGKQEAIPEHLRAMEEPAAPKTTPLTLVEPHRAEQLDLLKFEKPEISEAPVKEAEAAHEAAKAKTIEHEAAMSQHLGEGLAHRKRVAAKLNPLLEQRQSEIGKGYDTYIEGLKDKQVQLSNPRDAKVISHEIRDAITKGGYDSPEVKKLAQELESIGKANTIPADKFVSAYRTLRTMAQKVRSSAYGKMPDEFNRLMASADSMEADVSKMEDLINKGLGKENLKELHTLNKRYATEVAPLFKNKFYQEMQAKSKAPKGMMEHLTNEPYVRSTNPNKTTGTKILNDIIRNDPELLKHVVGEKYAKNPKELHFPEETTQEFVQHMPELQKLRNQHFEATQAEAKAKMAHERAKHEHRMAQEKATAAHAKKLEEARAQNKKAAEEAKEQTRLKKAETHKENERLKAEHKAKAEHFKIQEQLKGLDEKAKKLKDNAVKMHERARAQNVSLKEKMSIEKELAEAKKQLAKIEKDRKVLHRVYKGLGYAAAGLILGAPAVNLLKSVSGYHGS